MIELAAEYTQPADPVAAAAVAEAATTASHGYGTDHDTQRVQERILEAVGGVDCWLVTNGSAANVVAISAVLRRFESVVCASDAHLNVDEAGALERFTGAKAVPVSTDDGFLCPALLEPYLESHEPPHSSVPRVLSVSQASERGLVYSVDRVRELAAWAHAHEILVHVDGARFANAVASLGTTPREFALESEIDLLSLGFTKVGGVIGDAVVSFRPGLFAHVDFEVKQAMQMASRGRVLSAGIGALLDDDRWLRNATVANERAAELGRLLSVLADVELMRQPDINQVFVRTDPVAIERLHERVHFYDWGPGAARFVTSFATTVEDVRGAAAALRTALGA